MNSPDILSFHTDWDAQEIRTLDYVTWVSRFQHGRYCRLPVPDQSDPKPKTKTPTLRAQLLAEL